MATKLVVKVIAGADDAERVAQAFNVAATAVMSGVAVSLWLSGDATFFALPGKCEEFVLEHSAPLNQLRDVILADGSITVCTQCAVRRGIGELDLIPGIVIAGATSFVAEIIADNVQALVY
ncbi:MAG: DsrE family protein [Actinomycetes bacterium]